MKNRHDGRIAVAQSNLRWYSDGFGIGCDNGEKVWVAFALDCGDREVLGHVATIEGIKVEDVQGLMISAVEYCFRPVNRLPQTIEWLSDNGSGYIAHETKTLAREMGLEPRTTPVQSSQSNGIAEAFVRRIKRDYVWVSLIPDARTVLESLRGSSIITAFTRTRRSAIVPRVSSSPHVNWGDLSHLPGATTVESNSSIRVWWRFRQQSCTFPSGTSLNRKSGSQIEARLDYYAALNQVRNFESLGTWLLHAN